MKCDYCGSYISQHPTSGICPNCGAALPAPPPPAVHHVPYQQPPVPPRPGITCCPRCHSPNIRFQKRGYRWGLGLIMGLFILPFFGFLFGFIGSKQLRYTCNACSYHWFR